MIAFNYKYKDFPTFIFRPYVIVLILTLQQPVSSTYVAYENTYDQHLPGWNLPEQRIVETSETTYDQHLPGWKLPEQRIIETPLSETEYEYKSLCHMENINVTVSKDDDYEYFPRSYINVECRSPDTYVTKYTQMCDFAGFQCVKKIRTLPIFRRLYALWQREPWKLFKEEIQGYGCECKYPQKLYYN